MRACQPRDVGAAEGSAGKEKAGTYSQPVEQQPVVMPAGQRPDEWKFQKEKEAEAKKAVEDKKTAKKKAEEDKKVAAAARKKAEAERRLASKAAQEDAEKKRVEERRAAVDQKKAAETQRAADARAAREAAASKTAEEQKTADEYRALERRAAAEKAAEERRSEAEQAAEEVRMKEAAKKSALEKAAVGKAAGGKNAAEKNAEQKSAAKPAAAAPAPASKPANSPAPASTQKQSESQAAASASAQKPAGDAKPAGDKSAIDPMRPPAIIRADQQPDAWKMQSEKPRTEGAGGQGQTTNANASGSQSTGGKPGQGKPAASTPPKPSEPWRGWSDRALISLNAGWQASSFDLHDTRSFEPPFAGDREMRTLAADYSVQSGMSLDLGGGFRVWRALAAGVSVTRFKDSRDVPVSGTVPHPFFFNRARAVNGVTSGVRQEMAVHVDAMWVVPIRPKMTLALFGGPSFYSVKQTAVSDFDYNQSYPYDDVTLTRVISSDESSSVTGVNFGADVGYYFTETIGIGGLIRFGRASVDTSIGSIDVGGPEVGFGLRIRIPQGRPRPRTVTPQPPPPPTTPDSARDIRDAMDDDGGSPGEGSALSLQMQMEPSPSRERVG